MSNEKMTFGLTPEKIETIERIIRAWNKDSPIKMEYTHAVWVEIGTEIGWEPLTVALHYFRYRDSLLKETINQLSKKQESSSSGYDYTIGYITGLRDVKTVINNV